MGAAFSEPNLSDKGTYADFTAWAGGFHQPIGVEKVYFMSYRGKNQSMINNFRATATACVRLWAFSLP